MEKQTEKKRNIESLGKYVVAIGASAGGLDAINDFFENVPLKTNLSFVLIQHLSPDYKSMMPELLAKHTKLKVSKITDATAVQPNCVYTIPADKNVTILKGKLYLEDRGKPKTLNLPINIFLKSLAEDQKKRAIAVILSGTGSDGTLGVESIKEQGGMVIAQDPQTAAFDSMPKSIITTGLADFILSPPEMPETITNYVKHPYVKQLDPVDDDLIDSLADILHQILDFLYQKINMDFRNYKKATLIRRIERRMGINNILSKGQYLKFLKTSDEEATLLSNDILIGVTGFFRDRKAFELLDEKVLSVLVKNKEPGKELRVWVAGCSSGQEVYTLGILLKEQCRKQNKEITIKIFATDIDQRAINKASKGVYSEAIEQEVPSELLHRYFSKAEDQYHIKKELRELAIFARHDISRDPPFNNIDLATCRNLLIYIEPLLQEKIIALIHFSLVEKGYLFLGISESLNAYSKVFHEIDKKHKIFQNQSVNRVIDINRLFPFDQMKKPKKEEQKIEENSPRVISKSKILANFKDALLDDLVPPTVIINSNQEVVHVAGEIDKYLKLPKKQLTLNVLKMVDEQLYVTLSNTISKVRSNKNKTISPVIIFESETSILLNIIAKPYTETISRVEYYIISFIEAKQSHKTQSNSRAKTALSNEKNEHIKRLEEEIKETKDYLQSTVEELETSNEELQATNEELMAANEELQSSNEELQSVNEELYTVNNEFQDKISEMTELNDDLNNFIQSTRIATLFLDENLCIKRYTNIITPLIKISSNDLGRYIGDFTHVFKSFDMIAVTQDVLNNFEKIEREVATNEGKIYLMQALPYVTSKKEVRGVVITFVDINELKKIETVLKKQTEELEINNKELEQFAYLAAHDLKAPITNLKALTGLIDKNGNDFINKNNSIPYGKLKEVILRMERTIGILNEVITIKKNLDLRPEAINLDEAFKEVMVSIEDQATSVKAKIKTNFIGCPEVYFPAIHLNSILQNLITNAIKYKKANVAPVIEIYSEKDSGYDKLYVSDNGRGIDLESYGSKLFGLFQRFHLDTAGKGIGLHITKSIIERYNGYIEVKSKKGEGTTFIVYFKNKNTWKNKHLNN
ncbi:PAS domain-containing protein [Cellulophaga baltica]|uniref:chemotaxis protein CheB n=1 Tax=Cellulophaga TaxID=104264 RepID=UPI001C07924A|nr:MULTISPECIES: chemotaxis protein CheB [Cellulophaga]MBU2996925.1 PAS domain-containing protein [Cellulophaga baltica]MDO6768323.1 chemotaxis protein CheB [Cellulophaga sp. 1_MG-2023]